MNKPFQITYAELDALRQRARANADRFKRDYMIFMDTSGIYRVERYNPAMDDIRAHPEFEVFRG